MRSMTSLEGRRYTKRRIVREHVINRIEHEIAGSEFEVDIHEQIDRFVEQATLHGNLCQCYIGWCHSAGATTAHFVVAFFVADNSRHYMTIGSDAKAKPIHEEEFAAYANKCGKI
ncbi:FATC domain protein [Cooperia oncophora]